MSAISIHHLTKTYANGTKALHELDLNIQEGQFFALLGANGAGKTTLIGILTGLVTKTSGTVTVCGHDLDEHPNAVKTCLGVVPQEFNFSIFETVSNVVVDQAGFYGIPRPTALARAEELLTILGLWEKRNAPSRTLSGGMKRRLMIARALMHRPRVLLLDEPTAGVDVDLRRGMWDYLKQLNAEGTTILLTTHYLEEVEQLCQQVAILKRGEKVRDSSVRELLSSMSSRTFRMTFQRPLSDQEKSNPRFRPCDDQTVDIELANHQTVSDLVREVSDLSLIVTDIRPAANRLETAYLEITNQSV